MAGQEPVRTCVGCRTRFPKGELLRFVLASGEVVSLDARQTRPGRGAYVCARRKCLKRAVESGGFRRAFRCNAAVPDVNGIWEEVRPDNRL